MVRDTTGTCAPLGQLGARAIVRLVRSHGDGLVRVAGVEVFEGHIFAVTSGRDPSVLALAHHSHPSWPPRRRRILANGFRDRAMVVFVAVDSRANPKGSCTPPPRRRRVCFGETVEAASVGRPGARQFEPTERRRLHHGPHRDPAGAWRHSRVGPGAARGTIGVADVPLPRLKEIVPNAFDCRFRRGLRWSVRHHLTVRPMRCHRIVAVDAREAPLRQRSIGVIATKSRTDVECGVRCEVSPGRWGDLSVAAKL